MFCTQVVLRESSSDESSDTETKNAAAAAASTEVSNDKQPRVTANSCKNGQAFDGNLAFRVTVIITISCFDNILLYVY